MRKFLLIISEDEFLIESVHALFIEEIHQFCVAVCLRLQKSLGDEVTGGNQHAVRLIVSVVPHIPFNCREVDRFHLAKEHQ